MGTYILRRVITAVPTLILISMVIFSILALAPGDPLSDLALNPSVPPEVRQRIRENLGLEDPIPVQYAKWAKSLFTGEFGYSYFWWYNCVPTAAGLIEARAAVGNGQQRVFVMPGLDMVVTVFAGRYNDAGASTLGSRILRDHVIPAVKTGIRPGCPGA